MLEKVPDTLDLEVDLGAQIKQHGNASIGQSLSTQTANQPIAIQEELMSL